MTERESKRARLDTVLDAHGLDELVLRDPANLAWYLGGARVHVVPLEDAAILEVAVGRAGDERTTYDNLLGVEAAYLDATRPGAIGYATRDYLASPATDHAAEDSQAFTWNPSGGGFKVEDAVLATTHGPEILSPDPEWPAVAAGGRQRPDVLA